MTRIQKEFSQPWEIYLVLTAEVGGRPLATLHELQTTYSCTDLYDMLEIIDAYSQINHEQVKADERAAAAK